jgi:uncharacterized protein YndB with AHSA1/START domain
MRPAHANIHIDAPRERVFEVISDLANRPSFCDHFEHEFHLQRLDSTGVGATARFRADKFPHWMETEIAEIHAPHRLVERGRGARADRMKLGTAWELVEGPHSSTEVSVTFWAEPGTHIDKLRTGSSATRWHARQWKKALKRLREIAENEEPIEPVQVAGASRI